MIMILLAILVLVHAVYSMECEIAVNLTLGQICGSELVTPLGTVGQVFLGVPYAQAPLGPLRFSAARSVSAWNDTLECTHYKPACAQFGLETSSEDCLYLNVFTGANCTTNSSCPMLVFIHGGEYNSGSPSDFDDIPTLVDNFVARDIILVTVSYRLSSFGFFSTNTSEATGNWGMYDILEALRFVQNESAAFGGDVGNVTLYGSSSGAEGVSLLSLSNATQGLINRTIQIGGTAFTDQWVLNDNLTASHKLAEGLDCANSTSWSDVTINVTAILECVRNASASEILDIQEKLSAQDINFYTPRIDGVLFIGNVSEMAANRSEYQMMIGTSLLEYAPAVKAQFPTATVEDIMSQCNLSTNGVLAARGACVAHYTSSVASFTDQLVALVNDVTSFVPVINDASSMRTAKGVVFLHSYDYVTPGEEGVAPANGFDVSLLFKANDDPMKEHYLDLLGNFTKFGHPTPNPISIVDYWIPLLFPGAGNYYSVNITSGNKLSYHSDAVLFWKTELKIIDKISSKFTNESLALSNLFLLDSTLPKITNEGSTMVMLWVTVGLVGVVLVALSAMLAFKSHRNKKNKQYNNIDVVDETTSLVQHQNK